MANIFPAAVKARLAASGGVAAVSLLEVLTTANNRFYWSDASIAAPTALPSILVLSGGSIPTSRYSLEYPAATFLPWLTSAGPFRVYGSTATSSGSATIQNLSGNTVIRDGSNIFSRNMMTGALIYYRTWLPDAEFATFSFMGRVDDADVEADGMSMTLQFESLCCWAKIDAPNKDICQSCQLAFGSLQCGANPANSPCNNDYGSCQSIERFMGVLDEWTGGAITYNQYVQPAPLVLANPRRA